MEIKSWVKEFVLKAEKTAKEKKFKRNLLDYIVLGNDHNIPEYNGIYISRDKYMNENEIVFGNIKITENSLTIGKFTFDYETLSKIDELLKVDKKEEEPKDPKHK